jgi:hypothetical protein
VEPGDDEPQSTPDPAGSVVAALRRAHALGNWEDPVLASAVRAFAARARAEGVPPERLLITLKETTSAARLPGVSDWWRSIVSARVIKWAVEAYFDVTSTGEVPRFPE